MRYKVKQLPTMQPGEWGIWDCQLNNWYVNPNAHCRPIISDWQTATYWCKILNEESHTSARKKLQ